MSKVCIITSDVDAWLTLDQENRRVEFNYVDEACFLTQRRVQPDSIQNLYEALRKYLDE